MVDTDTLSDDELLTLGKQVLERELGHKALVRIIQYLCAPVRDYTAERHKWLDHLTPEDIAAGAQQIERQHARK